MVARQFNQRRSFGKRGLDRSISVEVFVVVEPNYHRTVELVNVHILIDKPRQVSTAAVAVMDVDQSGDDCTELSAECIAASFPWEIRRGKLSGIEVDDRVAVARQNVRVGNIVGGRRLADAIMILHELHADGAIVWVAIDNIDTGTLQRPHTAVAGAVQHVAHRKKQREIENVAIPKTILAGIRMELAEIVRAAAGNHFTETVRGRSA